MNQTLATLTPEQASLSLAFDIVAKLSDPADIAARHGLSGGQMVRLVKTPQFQKLMVEARKVWYSDANASARSKAKAALMVEDSLMSIFRLVHDDEIHPSTRLEAVRVLMIIADMDGGEKMVPLQQNTMEQYNLTINIGTQEPTVISANACLDGEVEDGEEAA